MTTKPESNFGRDIFNFIKCFKLVQFENSDDTIEEYEVDNQGNKYCSKCFNEIGLDDN